jgi:ATP-binding protein involved in chromosome partitioning
MSIKSKGEAPTEVSPNEDHDLDKRAMELSLKQIKHKILVMSGKGGVGKSTVAANLAVGLSKRDYAVGIMDVDLHGPDIPKMLGLELEMVEAGDRFFFPLRFSDNLKVISIASMIPSEDTPLIWRGPLKIGIIRQFISNTKWGELDYLIIDAPPGTGDEPLTIAQTIPDAKAILVTTPQEISLLDVRKSISFCREVKMPILGIVENMSGFVCPHCGKESDIFGRGGGERVANKSDIPLLAQIPLERNIMSSSEAGVAFMDSGKNDSLALKAFAKLVTEVIDRTSKTGN